MDSVTYETVEIPKTRLQWEKNFLVEGVDVTIQQYNDEILGASLPDQVIMVVAEAEEAVQGNTVQSVQKKAWTSTGLELQVPQFIKTGEKVYVNTSDGAYVGRAK
jgi:elongation factor P